MIEQEMQKDKDQNQIFENQEKTKELIELNAESNRLRLLELRCQYGALTSDDLKLLYGVSAKSIKKLDLPCIKVLSLERYIPRQVQRVLMSREEKTHDQKTKNQEGYRILPSEGNGSGFTTVQEFRDIQRRKKMGKSNESR